MVNISIAHSFLHFVPRDPREIHVSGQKDMLHPPYWLVSSPNLSKPFADQTLVVQGHGHPGKIWRRVREVSDRSMLGSGARLNKGIVWTRLFYSPHHCVGFLFFAWIPPGQPPPPPPLHLHSLTHSLTHSLIHHSSLHHLSHQISLIIHYCSLHYLSPLTHHSPLFSTPLITSHSSFTTLHYTTHHISLIIHHSSLHHLSPLTHHSPLFTTLLITSHSSFTTLHYTT